MFKVVSYFLFVIMSMIHYQLKAEEIHNKYLITKTKKINVRTGPNFRYATKFTYIKKDVILKIKDTFDDWYLIEDLEGDEGWVYKNVVSQKNKMITTKTNIFCYKEPFNLSKVVLRSSPLINFQLKSCTKDFCLVERDGIKGWCERKYIWGI